MPRTFVLDTSVAVKWYLPEDLHEEAIGLARHAQTGEVELLAPGTLQPEFFNALWQQHKRNNCHWVRCVPPGDNSPKIP